MNLIVDELELSFSFEYGSPQHSLTIWADGGFVEVYMNDKQLEDLKGVLDVK